MSRRSVAYLLLGLAVLAFATPIWAGRFQSAVGGVAIDAEGVVRDIDAKTRAEVLRTLRDRISEADPEMAAHSKLRKVSLRKLQDAIAEHLRTGKELPDEIRYLAGLQRIQYIFVYPERNDIVIAGPGEGWKVDDTGAIVGKTTGRPVLHLDDLLVAMRYVHAARTEGISCSIDPTQEGQLRLQRLLDSQKQYRGPRDLARLEAGMKEAFGPQQIKITGVPASSRYARILLAADYRMKRYGMNLEPAPVAGLPSYVQMLRNSSATSPNPRWWMACNYDSIARSADGLAWEIRDPGVKVLTEDEFVNEDGKVVGTGRTSPIAKKWADLFTEKYGELAEKDPVFAELQNIMDLSVVAAILESHGLMETAGLNLQLMATNDGPLAIDARRTPRTLAPQCSFLRTRKGWVVTASGGVQIESWQVADNTVVAPDMTLKRETLGAGPDGAWWWN